ncbi:MAG: calcium/sodium antiporter [Candidatus Kapabacteria bacterium]|nr:calcium/sodium antiporter [Candidatus Kapabacteria bacterium]MDW7996103.1 calcium/sodium antiporter [Bacteroidota bacterium]
MSPLLGFAIGLGALILGAEWLVRGASHLAIAWRVPPLVVGLTVVAYGTSSPELAVSVQAAWSGQEEVALGNVIGSNIFNVLFILGLSALIIPLAVNERLIRLDVPLMIGVSLVVYVMSLDGAISRVDGVLLVVGAIAYTLFLFRAGAEGAPAEKLLLHKKLSWRDIALYLLLVLAGLGLLVAGSRWLVRAAVDTATALGVNPIVIGLTIVAAGTSLPEVVTSIVAALRKARDLAVGNVVGSNLFNLLLILGAAAVVAPSGIPVPPSVRTFDLPIMLATAVACLPIFHTSRHVERWEGGLFLAYYGLYTGYLVIDALGYSWVSYVEAAVLGFVLPLTAITLLVLFLGHRFRSQSPPTPPQA